MDIETPTPFRTAFAEPSEAGFYSQAALLLAVGLMLQPPNEDTLRDFEEEQEVDWPRLPRLEGRYASPAELDVARSIDRLLRQPLPGGTDMRGLAAELVGRMYSSDGPRRTRIALGLTRLYMEHPAPLLRAAAGATWLDLVDVNPEETVNRLVRIIVGENDELARLVAMLSLYRRLLVQEPPTNPPPQASKQVSTPRTGTNEAVLVHGTLFVPTGKPIDEWWQPGSGDFHQYLRSGPRPNVYNGPDYFWWSGGWNDKARVDGQHKLLQWIHAHCSAAPDVFAHSHGGNLSMLASWYQPMRQLVLLACPVHWRLFSPCFANIDEVVSIRTRWDLVIMADRGAQRFRHPKIVEHVLPYWFTGHDRPRQSSVWKKHGLDKLV